MADAASVIEREICELARGASIEINVQDVADLDASKQFLAAGKKMYVSHLPKQTWEATIAACLEVNAAGFAPIPHIPVRLIDSASTLHALLEQLVGSAGVNEVLLIAGDYAQARGPYPDVSELLGNASLSELGLRGVSFAGHPEGHPTVNTNEIRRAEISKSERALDLNLQPTLLTQFFFEAEPFLTWTRELRTLGVKARLLAGLAGPTKATTLIKYALRCGVGASLRALQRSSTRKLLNEHGPEHIIRKLAQAKLDGVAQFDGLHFFCFGGFLRTSRWLHAIATERFAVTEEGFNVHE